MVIPILIIEESDLLNAGDNSGDSSSGFPIVNYDSVPKRLIQRADKVEVLLRNGAVCILKDRYGDHIGWTSSSRSKR